MWDSSDNPTPKPETASMKATKYNQQILCGTPTTRIGS
jgi:hypothetical protein